MKESQKETLLDNLRKICKLNNLKLTPQRIMLYRELLDSTDHPSADIMFKKAKKKFPSISFDTVNRTLLTFSRIGVVSIVEGYGSPRRFDPNVIHHHHFHCIKCQEISDFVNQTYDELNVPDDIQNRCVVFNKKVILEGICEACKN
jgi:Fur family peroxide stress response transcriptional regulator